MFWERVSGQLTCEKRKGQANLVHNLWKASLYVSQLVQGRLSSGGRFSASTITIGAIASVLYVEVVLCWEGPLY